MDNTASRRLPQRGASLTADSAYLQQPIILFHDLDARPRQNGPTARPQTADAKLQCSEAARVSFFEAFAIDAGDDKFAFPKPQSAKSTPKQIDLMASLAPSRETSPLIGVAIGSPTHPAQYWTKFPSATATPRTPRFTETFFDDVFPFPQPAELAAKPAKTSGWKKMGNLFRKADKTKASPELAKTARPTTSATQDEPRPKSRGRLLTSRGKPGPLNAHPVHVDEKIDLRIDDLARPDMSPQVSSPILTSLHTIWKAARASSDGEASPRPSFSRIRSIARSRTVDNCQPIPQIVVEPAREARPQLPPPKLELDLPPSQMERYSVMFENVLDNKSSLLERRKSRLRLLETSDEHHTMPDLTSLTPLPLNKSNADAFRPLARSATSPHLSPRKESFEDDAKQSRSDHKTTLRRSKTSPAMHVSPLRFDFKLETILPTSPSTDDGTAAGPDTPSSSAGMTINVQVIDDAIDRLRAEIYKDSTSNVWQSVLPAPPGSSTSSRFSVDVHKALESPRYLTRSRSLNRDNGPVSPIGRQVQVATARTVSISRPLSNSRTTTKALRPKMIQVGSQPHSRKTSVLDSESNMIDTRSIGIARG